MSLYFWTVVPLTLLHFVCARRFPDVLRFQLLLDIVLLAVVGPALISGGDLNPVRCVANLPPYRSVVWSPITQLQPTQSDVVFQFHPWWENTGGQLRRGQLPSIQPTVGGGLPLLANGQTGLLAPVMAPVWILGPERGTTVMAFWKIELAGLGAFLLMFRAWRLGRSASCVGGLAWAGNPYLVGWLLVPLAWLAAFLPWAWWLMWHVTRGRAGPRAALCAGAVFGWIMGSGLHPETAAIVCGSALLMALIAHPGRWWRLVLVTGGAGMVAVALAWPTVGLIAASSRHAMGADGAANRDRLPWEIQRDLSRQLVVPAAMGHPGRGDWRADYPHAPGAVGVGGAVLALVALGRWRKRYRRLGIAAASVTILGAVLLLRIPPLDALLVRIPPLDQMSLPRFGVLIPWGLGVLAVLGLDGAMHGRPRGVLLRLTPAVVASFVALSVGAGKLAGLDVLLVGLTVVMAFVVGLTRGRRLVAALVVGELSLLAVAVNPVAATDDRLPQPELVSRLVEMGRMRPSRIVGLGLMLPANLGSRYGLRDLRASDPLRPAPFVRLMRVLGEPETILGGRLSDLPAGLCGAWGVGFALAPPGKPLPGWNEGWSGRDGTIWLNPSVLPEIRVVGAIREQPQNLAALQEMVRHVDFSTTALVHSGVGPVEADEVAVQVGMRTPTRLEANVECNGPCLLVFEQPWAPGWKGRVNGERADIVLADIAGMAVKVPGGRHRVELAYHPWRWWPPGDWPAGAVGGS